jgi:hypothetical protein
VLAALRDQLGGDAYLEEVARLSAGMRYRLVGPKPETRFSARS